jgi:hypothetical protein
LLAVFFERIWYIIAGKAKAAWCLADRIRQDEEAGKSQWEAIVGFTVRRFSPIANSKRLLWR